MSDRMLRDPVEALLRSAGPGVEPDAARMDRALRVVHGEWSKVVTQRRRARWLRLAAACAAIGLLASLWAMRWSPTLVPAGTVARAEGEVLLRHTARGRVAVEALQSGRVTYVGEEIDTSANGRALLNLTSGASIRVDAHSLLQWTSPGELHLLRGTVYVETANGEKSSGETLAVATPLGEVRHVGTRFEVRVGEGRVPVRVRVRDGLVNFSRQREAPVAVAAGQQLDVAEGHSTLRAGPGSADPEWSWTRAIAPRFAIDGRSLFESLEWLGHETGLRVVYASDDARRQARQLTLRGSIEGLDTGDALRAVLAGSGLEFELHMDWVEVRSGDAH